MSLSGKPIIITGASSGIGLATAIECARAGMHVVLNARSAGDLQQAQCEVEAAGKDAGARAVFVAGDVNTPGMSQQLVDASIEHFGSVYAVFANAGYGFETIAHECDDDTLRQSFETNYFSAVDLARTAVPYLLRQRAGHVIMCSSTIGKIAVPYMGPYCAAKAAMAHHAAAMAWELKPNGVYVSSLHPVGIKTKFFEKAKEVSPTGGITLESHSPDWLRQTPETVAKGVVKCLKRPKREIWPSWSWATRLGIAIATAFPSLPDRHFKHMVHEFEKHRGKA